MQILVVVPVSEENKKLIESSIEKCSFVYSSVSEVTQEEVSFADIIFGNVPPHMVEKNKKLKWLQTNSAGVEGYIKDGILPVGCKLTNATGGYGLAISEHLLAMYLEIIKKLNLYRDEQLKGHWTDLGTVTSVYGSTVLILGLGDIGTEFAKRCKAMGAYVIGVRRKDATPSEFADEVQLIDKLDELLPRADAVAIALPGTAETAGMFSRERIEKMKNGAVILNVGRGSIIDTEALCDALESGKLSGAGLDVTNPEPLPSEHRLWKIPTAVITPHVSGGFHLFQTHERIVGIFADNLLKFTRDVELTNIVDFSTGYRKLTK